MAASLASAGPRRAAGGVRARRPSPDRSCRCLPRRSPVVASASGVEIVSSDAAVPGRFQPEVTESALVPLVNQFSMMQQQMFDQFQQAMGMLVQMFGTMHREQMEVIREELDRLHDLSRELQELKDELAKSSSRPAPPPGAPAAAPDPARSTEVPIPAPAAAAPGPRRPIGPVTTPPPPPTAPRPDQPRPGLGSPGTAGAPGLAGTDRDAVAWIHQRIMTIQHERETRWQKIIKLLPGVS